MNANFYINGQKVIPNSRNRRLTARQLPGTEKEVENNLLATLRSVNFNYEKSPLYLWLRQVTHSCMPGGSINTQLLSLIAKFFANQLKLELGREFYRRRSTLVFWLEIHSQEIINFISQNSVFIEIDQLVYPFFVPQMRVENVSLNYFPSYEVSFDTFIDEEIMSPIETPIEAQIEAPISNC